MIYMLIMNLKKELWNLKQTTYDVFIQILNGLSSYACNNMYQI